MTVRLNNDLRQTIAHRLMAPKVKEFNEWSKAQEAELAIQCYQMHYPPQDRDELVRLHKKGWVAERSHLNVEYRLKGSGSTRFYDLRFGKPVPVAHKDADYRNDMKLHLEGKKYEDLAGRIHAYRMDRDAKNQALRELHRETEATLATFTSFKQLIEAWPEIETLVADLNVSTPKYQVPAHLGKLTKVFDLPREKEATQ